MNSLKLFPTLLVTLCASASAATVTLQQGQTGQLGEYRVTVVRVQDSRCPPTANCVWAGKIVAKLLVVGEGKTRYLTVQLPAEKTAAKLGIYLTEATFDKLPKLTFYK